MASRKREEEEEEDDDVYGGGKRKEYDDMPVGVGTWNKRRRTRKGMRTGSFFDCKQLLSPQDEEQVDQALDQRLLALDAKKVLTSNLKVDITRKKMSRCLPGKWLKDELINFYLQLLRERHDRVQTSCRASNRIPPPPCFLADTYFVTNMREQKVANVITTKTKNADLFSMSKVIFPVHDGHAHWFVCVVFMDTQEIQYVLLRAWFGTLFIVAGVTTHYQVP